METAPAFFGCRREAHTGWRHHLHQWPEMVVSEHDTAAFLADHLHRMGLKAEDQSRRMR